MPTFDHRIAGYRDIEMTIGSTGANTVVSSQGGIRYNGTAFQMADAQGQFDPRTAFAAIHANLYDLPHIMAGNGPVLSGAVKTVVYVGGVFLLSETWWTSSAQTIAISKHAYTYPPANFTLPTTESWTQYTATGAVLRTVTDQIQYSGINEVQRIRSVT